MSATGTLKDVVTPSLKADPRGIQAPREMRRIYTHSMYDVYLCLLPEGRVTALIHYKQEQLRIMTGLPIQGSFRGTNWVKDAVFALDQAGLGPFHLVRDAKLECGLMLSLFDRAALRLASVEIPRSAGRYKDLFQESP